MGKSKDTLTPQQQKFVSEYVKTLNATTALQSAGFCGSKKTLVTRAGQILNLPSVKLAIQKAIDDVTKANQLTADMVIDEIKTIAFADISEAFNSDGTPKPIDQLPPSIRKSLNGLDVEGVYSWGKQIGSNKRVRFVDKMKALEMLAKYFKLLTDKVEVDASGNLADRINEARNRANEKSK